MDLEEFKLIEPVPELKNPCAIAMLRPWIDVGRVGTLVLGILEKKLGASELGRLKNPGNYYDFTRYRPRTTLVDETRILSIPNSVIYYAQDVESEQDYLFLHLREPHIMGEKFTEAVVALLEHFKIKEYCRIGGMYDSVPHTRPVMITGSVNEFRSELVKDILSPRKNTYEGPTSIVNLVTEAMEKSDIDTVSLMAHLPQYVQLEEDHMGAARIMEVLCNLYGFPKTFADYKRGEKQYNEIDRAIIDNNDVRNFITQLEKYYDRILVNNDEVDKKLTFSPEVEKFLLEMGNRLEGSGNGEDGM